MPRYDLALPLFLALALCAPVARGADIPCAPVERRGIRVDGLLGDWRGVSPVRFDRAAQVLRGRDAWKGRLDLSFSVRCNHDRKTLFLAIEVKDEYFVRSPKAKGDDHLRITLGRKTLLIYPGDLRNIKQRVTWGRRQRARRVRVAEAMQERGYSVEVALPLRRIAGYRPGMAAIPLIVTVADSDSKARGRIDTELSSGPTRLAFAQSQADISAFLNDKGLKRRDIRFRGQRDVVGDGRVEQVLLAGKTLAIIGSGLPGGGYFFVDLPVRATRDIAWVKLIDLNGDGQSEIVMRYTERAQNGRRDLLAVYRFDSGNKFVRPFAHELLKGQGKRLITNRYTFKRRRKRRGKRGGVDLIFDKPKARGFSVETYHEAKAEDVSAIILPWDETRKKAFRFEGDEYFEY